MPNVAKIMLQVNAEVQRARRLHKPPCTARTRATPSSLKEEVDELWDEIKLKHSDPTRLRREAIQIAAMAVAFVHEVCDREIA